MVVVFERQDFCFAPVVHGDALHVAEKVRTRCGVGLPSDELGVEPDFALGKFDRERPVEFAVDLERHEFVVDRHPVVFANQVCQLPDPDFVAAPAAWQYIRRHAVRRPGNPLSTNPCGRRPA